MLRNFRVVNHRSIRDEQELSMLPIYDKERKVMPVAGIYGANASGKTALVDAFRYMRSAVLDSYRFWDPRGGVPRSPFKLDVSAMAEPSGFVVDLELNGTVYTYGFEVSDRRVEEEWLYAYPENRKRVIFERTADKIKFGSTVANYRSLPGELNRFLRDNALVIPTAVQSMKLPEIDAVYEWFDSHLRVHTDQEWRSVDDQRVADAIRRRPGLVHLLRAADVGITDVKAEEAEASLTPVERKFVQQLTEAEREATAIANQLRKKIVQLRADDRQGLASQKREELVATEAKLRLTLDRSVVLQAQLSERALSRQRTQVLFTHGGGDMVLTLAEESDGTIAWLGLMVAAFDVLGEGGVLVVDELDASLHPKLTAHLLEAFQEPHMNPAQAQMIFTTHDSVLLGPAFGSFNLGRDEVWFVDKAQNGASTVYPLSDFRPRKDDSIDRRYLHGSYGAVPGTDQFDMYKALVEAGVIEERPR